MAKAANFPGVRSFAHPVLVPTKSVSCISRVPVMAVWLGRLHPGKAKHYRGEDDMTALALASPLLAWRSSVVLQRVEEAMFPRPGSSRSEGPAEAGNGAIETRSPTTRLGDNHPGH